MFRSRREAGGYSADSDDDEDGQEQASDRAEILMEGATERKKKSKRKNSVSGDGDKKVRAQKAKRAILSPFSKVRKLIERPPSDSSDSRHQLSSLPPSGSKVPRRRGKRRRFGNFCFCRCFSRPQAVENNNLSDGDDTSDDYEYLKSMIEKNDFYSKECNTHIGH